MTVPYALPNVDYGYRCLTCKVGRYYGKGARLRAEIEGGKHARNRDTHRVAIVGLLVFTIFDAHENMNTLENSQDPPF